MTNERARWTDERLDDFAAGLREAFADVRTDLAGVQRTLSQMQADELEQLRKRAARAESEVREARTQHAQDEKASRTRRVGYAVAIGVPLMSSALGALTGALLSHAF